MVDKSYRPSIELKQAVESLKRAVKKATTPALRDWLQYTNVQEAGTYLSKTDAGTQTNGSAQLSDDIVGRIIDGDIAIRQDSLSRQWPEQQFKITRLVEGNPAMIRK